jgi:hypothetical protein
MFWAGSNWSEPHPTVYALSSGPYPQPGIPRLIFPALVTDIRVQDSHDSTVRPPLPPRLGSITRVSWPSLQSGAALYDARFSISDLHHTIPAYAALLVHAFTINMFNRVTQFLTLNFLSPDISHALVVFAASILTVPLHVFGKAVSLCSRYPFPLSFSLLFLFPRTLSSSFQYHSSFTFSYIPTVIVSSFLTLLFTRQWPRSDLCLIPIPLSHMHSGQPSPACDDRAAAKSYYCPTSAPSLHLQSPARSSTSCC